MMRYLVEKFQNTTSSIVLLVEPALKPLIVVHFFNHHSDDLANSIEGLLRSMLFQILREQTTLVEATFENHHENRKIHSAYTLTVYGLEKMLSTLLQHRDCPPILTFVDALDEHHGEDIKIAEFIDRVSQIRTT